MTHARSTGVRTSPRRSRAPGRPVGASFAVSTTGPRFSRPKQPGSARPPCAWLPRRQATVDDGAVDSVDTLFNTGAPSRPARGYPVVMATVEDGAVDSVDTLFNAARDTTGVAYSPDEDVSVPLSEPAVPPTPSASPTHRLFQEEPASPRREPPQRASRRQRASGHVGKRSRAGARRRSGRSRGRHTWGDTPLIGALVQGRVSMLHLAALCLGIVVLTVLVSVFFAGGGSRPNGEDAKPTSAHRAAPAFSGPWPNAQAELLEARRSTQRSQARRAARQAAADRAAARHRADRRRAAALRAARRRAARARAQRATPPPPPPAPRLTTTHTTTSHPSPTTRPRAPAPPQASGGTQGSCTPGDLGC